MPFTQRQQLGQDRLPNVRGPGDGFHPRNQWHPLENSILYDAQAQPLMTWQDRSVYMQQQVGEARGRAADYERQIMQQPGFVGGDAWNYYAQHSASGIPQRTYDAGNVRRRGLAIGGAAANTGWIYEPQFNPGPSTQGYDYFGHGGRW